jgi:hypothetical protein
MSTIVAKEITAEDRGLREQQGSGRLLQYPTLFI